MAYYDGTDPYKAPLGPGDAPSVEPTSPTSGPVVGMTPVPGHPGLYYNTAGVVFNASGQPVDGYVNPATGAFQTGAPTTDPDTGIVGPPSTEPVAPPPPTGGTAPPPTTGGGGGYTAPPPSYSAPPPGGATGGYTATGGSTSTGVPPMVAPPYAPPPAYSAPRFTPPTADAVYSDPSFQLRFGMGEQALENSRAAQGTMGTGGTIKDFINYGQNFASQEYGKIYDRAFQTWAANNGTDKSVYDTNYQSQYTDPFAFAQHQADQANSLGFNYNVLGQQTSDSAFDRWYRTMLLKNQVAQ